MENTDEIKEEQDLPLWRAWLAKLSAVLWIIVLAWALYGLHKEWSSFHLKDLNEALQRVGRSHLLLALLFTVVAYLCNAAIGVLSQVWLGVPHKNLLSSFGKYFITGAFTINAGGSLLGGGSIRLRLAAAQGLNAEQVGKATLFTVIVGWCGAMFLCGLIMIFFHIPLPWLSAKLAHILGVPFISVALCLPLLGFVFPKKFPPFWIGILALFAAAVDWLCAGLAMWALLSDALVMNPFSCVGLVMLSQAVASVSHVPGGVGVLEFTLMKAFSGLVSAPVLAGVLIIYRLIYYLFPFFCAIILLGYYEVRLRHRVLLDHGNKALLGWRMVAPRLAMILTLAGGFMLLLSANTPIEESRRGIVSLFPLAFVEASHFISSLAGAFLIVLARGLQRRISSAWWLSVLTMSGGIVFSLMKGFDWEEALVLCFLLVCLLSSKKYFHRHAALWQYRFTGTWWLLLLALLGVSMWVGFFTARHVAYQRDLWWEFALDGDASRFLRATTGAACVFLIVALMQALRPTKHPVHNRNYDEAKVSSLVEESSRAEAALAFLEDKSFVYSDDGKSGLMYADQGRSRIVMADPLGDTYDADDVLWRFVEQASDEGMRVVFYQISVAEIPRMVDMGFKLFKLGEEARVKLSEFHTEGPKAKKLRQAKNRFSKYHLKFEIWSQAETIANLPLLKSISDAWLATHKAGEKRFSLGCFNEAYVEHFPCAVVKNADGVVIAFCNMWLTKDKTEISVDLMRHTADAPSCVMEAIFIELIEWGKLNGYEYFNLGMAPLSGLSTHAIAPLWNKIAARIFHKGEAFYNFQGLRSFKEKFSPEWSPRYIAVSNLWCLPTALFDVTVLIGGGIKNTLGKKS